MNAVLDLMWVVTAEFSFLVQADILVEAYGSVKKHWKYNNEKLMDFCIGTGFWAIGYTIAEIPSHLWKPNFVF
jgi:hypothetical protein